jgi:hypothetical protein
MHALAAWWRRHLCVQQAVAKLTQTSVLDALRMAFGVWKDVVVAVMAARSVVEAAQGARADAKFLAVVLRRWQQVCACARACVMCEQILRAALCSRVMRSRACALFVRARPNLARVHVVHRACTTVHA